MQLKPVIISFIFIFVFIIYHANYNSVARNDPRLPIDFFVTSKGKTQLDEVVENVYQKFGYTLVKNNLIPVLKKSVPMNCNDVFSEWQKVIRDNPTLPDAPKEMKNPEAFLMNNYSSLSNYYCNQVPKNVETALPVWEETFVNDYVSKVKIDPHGIPATYGNESVAVYMATKYFNISGQIGAVIGSLSPWVEAFLLANGAANITTVDYQKIKIMHPQMNFLFAPDLPSVHKIYDNYFDFIVSFSSIEHSGLGRFGDPIDPIGDIREMNKIRCLLKKDGLLFFGVPVGKDEIAYNAHRIYGRIRLAMMFEGFKILQMFYGDAESPLNMEQRMLEEGFHQYLFVLQKID